MDIRLAQDYELRKIDNLNWKLYKRKPLKSGKRKGEVDWVGLPAYFGTVERALLYILNYELLDRKGTVTLDETLREMRAIEGDIGEHARAYGELR